MSAKSAKLLSPLRYPGAKRKLVGFIREVLNVNGLEPKLFVEPFAGGAGVSLQLLCEGAVDKVGLGEKDDLIASFWKAVFNDTDWLIDQVEKIEISLEKWDEFKNAKPEGRREKAIACLFLNRTSFSGILAPSAGPLGGREQESDYGIDCRFYRDTIIQRIRDIAGYRDRVAFVKEASWQKTLAHVNTLESYEREDVFFYLDPPFYEKANRLYTHYFEHADHESLRDELATQVSPWLLSYDACETVEELYMLNGHRLPNGHDRVEIDVSYSASVRDASKKSRELAVTNLKKLPQA